MISSLYTEAEKKQVHWFVMRAYKNEKLAEEKLSSSNGLEHFIPKHYAVRTYHGKKTRQLVPVIPSLLFVHASHSQITEFKQTQYNLLQFVVWEGSKGPSYLIVSDEEMENFMKVATQMQEKIEYVNPEEINIKQGTFVRIHGGEMDGVTGYFMRVKGRRNRQLVILLKGVVAITAEVQPDLVEVIEE